MIDALSLWCNGFRHVTACYGTSGWTPDHDAFVDQLAVKRVLIAFDADKAGDKGAADLARDLAERGVTCYRVELPRGSDVNEVAIGAKDARAALGRFLRKASWMGGDRTGRELAPVEASFSRVVSAGDVADSVAEQPSSAAVPVPPAPEPVVGDVATGERSWPAPAPLEVFSSARVPDAGALGEVTVVGKAPRSSCA